MTQTPKITVIPQAGQGQKLMRVAAYCRVSSDSADQLHSYASQIQYYTDLIGGQPGWVLADIYADEGLTGTKVDKREDFLRMINDCRKGKIDRILTKSISRFARNTLDTIQYVRKLKEYGVTILFEAEQIDTAYLSSEMLLAISGARAQEESLSISKNLRMNCRARMREGKERWKENCLAMHQSARLWNQILQAFPIAGGIPDPRGHRRRRHRLCPAGRRRCRAAEGPRPAL